MWTRQFRRMKAKIERSAWFAKSLDPDLLAVVKRRIADEGPLSTHAFDSALDGPREMWRRPPHKQALDYLWYSGELATCHRRGFTKVYDLAERVFPADLLAQNVSDRDQIDWLCQAAIDRIGFGSLGEIRKFWQAADVSEVSAWARRSEGALIDVDIQGADGTWTKALASADIETRLADARPVTPRLRILNPFDPAIRDRSRLKRLFGFEYTVEMFVPATKRKWGYYVYPVLEGARFVGRIEARADRKADLLQVINYWPEPGEAMGRKRADKLHAELQRFARLAGLRSVAWSCQTRPPDV